MNDEHDEQESQDNGPPVIPTEFGGPVTEWARLQAAANMRLVPEVKARVIGLIGEEKARRNYPEAFDDRGSEPTTDAT